MNDVAEPANEQPAFSPIGDDTLRVTTGQPLFQNGWVLIPMSLCLGSLKDDAIYGAVYARFENSRLVEWSVDPLCGFNSPTTPIVK